MKHPTLDYAGLESIMNLIPRNTPWFYVLYSYIVVVLKRNNGNRSHTSNEIKMPLRTLRFRFSAMQVLGFEIPPFGGNRKKENQINESNEEIENCVTA